MAGWRLSRSIVQIWLAATIQLRTVLGWNREQCIATVKETVNSYSSSSVTPNPAWFFSLADPNNSILTVEGCEVLCDSKMGFYSDSGPRLITWLLPIILLIANMQFAPIGKK